MIKLKTPAEIEILRVGGQKLAGILAALKELVRPGVTTAFLNDQACSLIAAAGAEPSFLNYRPAGSRLAYPAALCVSLNEEIVHGIPSPRVLQMGELVTLDLGIKYQGLYTDAAITVPVGQVSKEAQKLINLTVEALAAGIAAAQPGARLGDIGAAVEAVARRAGLGVVTDLAGHGVGYAVHEDPYVPNYGRPGTGESIKPGLVIAIEPMFTLGRPETKLEPDGFTFSTADRSLSCHFEHTVAITENGPEILTEL